MKQTSSGSGQGDIHFSTNRSKFLHAIFRSTNAKNESQYHGIITGAIANLSKFSDTDSDVGSPSPTHLRAMARTGLSHSTASLQSPLVSPKILHNNELVP